MNEQKIAPMLVKDIEQMAVDAGAEIARVPMYGRRISFAPDQLIHFLGLHEQAVLARVGAELEAAKAERDDLLVIRDNLEKERAEQWRKRRDAEADRDTNSAVIAELNARVGAVRDQALLEVIQALNGNPFSLTKSECVKVVETLKGTPAAAVADAYPARLLHESDKSLAERVDSWHARNPAPQSSGNPGPLAAVEPEADMFWDDDDPERGETSLHDIMTQAWDNGARVGDVVTVQRAKRMPIAQVRITAVPDSEGNGDFEYVEDRAAIAASKGDAS